MAKKTTPTTNDSVALNPTVAQLLRPGQSVELLKVLHILTRDGQLNQDSRRKLKQVAHLLQFIEPLLQQTLAQHQRVCVVDHGAGKSYLGFMLYDLFFTQMNAEQRAASAVIGIETRQTLVDQSTQLAAQLGFEAMQFINLPAAQAVSAAQLARSVNIVTALHACNTATDDAIAFALTKAAEHIVLVPCCQAQVASALKQAKSNAPANASRAALSELWRRPLHTREFGSQITNVLRCLQLESHGYTVTVTELVGWEHSMKNELILASKTKGAGLNRHAAQRLQRLLESIGLQALSERFFTPFDQAKLI